MKKTAAIIKKVFKLLLQTEPIQDKYDIIWPGPYFIPQPRHWYPSSFTLYAGRLYCQLMIEGTDYNLSWQVGNDEVKFEQGWGHYTWKKGMKSILPVRKISHIEKMLEKSRKLPYLKKMTLSMYLDTAATAYNAVFKELHPFSPLEKYQKRADGRHGGLLDLAQNDPAAFEKWYHGKQWSGCHPWEIVPGLPLGIMLAPHYNREKGWNYILWVDSLGWRPTAALMALALAEKNIPFEFQNSEEVLNTLKGMDDVDVGPIISLAAIRFEELKESRPDSIKFIQWEPIPQITAISSKQKKQVLAVLPASHHQHPAS